jgi:hypothetical protein
MRVASASLLRRHRALPGAGAGGREPSFATDDKTDEQQRPNVKMAGNRRQVARPAVGERRENSARNLFRVRNTRSGHSGPRLITPLPSDRRPERPRSVKALGSEVVRSGGAPPSMPIAIDVLRRGGRPPLFSHRRPHQTTIKQEKPCTY